MRMDQQREESRVRELALQVELEKLRNKIRCLLGSLDLTIMCLPQMQLLNLDFVIEMSFMRTNFTCMSTCFNLHPKILPCLCVLTSHMKLATHE